MAKKRQRATRSRRKTAKQRAEVEPVDHVEDRRAWLRVLVAQEAGRESPREDLRRAKRYETREEQRKRWEHYKTIPQGHWRKMAGGRQTSTINRQADTYGIPFGGEVVDLGAVVLALHEFLARNARVLAAARRDGEGDALLVGPTSQALERYRDERAKLAKLERLEREGTLLRREHVHGGLAKITHILREAAGALRRQYGNDAADLLDDALSDAEREIDRYFAELEREHA
jgi:hypothetical protein